MGSYGVVESTPLLDEYDGFRQRVEDFAVQELVSEFAVEAFVVAILPRTGRLDEERLDTDACEPTTNELGRELRAVIGT